MACAKSKFVHLIIASQSALLLFLVAIGFTMAAIEGLLTVGILVSFIAVLLTLPVAIVWSIRKYKINKAILELILKGTEDELFDYLSKII